MSEDPWALMFANAVGPWFKWFAWYPVRTEDRGWRWLRFVWRRPMATKPHLDGPHFRWFQHVVKKG